MIAYIVAYLLTLSAVYKKKVLQKMTEIANILLPVEVSVSS